MKMLHATRYTLHEKGFTLIELLIYCGLSLIVVTLFGSILVTITRVQNQQTSARQVTTEADFVMNVIKRDVRNSSWFESHGAWMSLITPSSSGEIIIDISGGAIRKQEVSGGPFIPLTTSRVVADSLSFTDLSSGTSKALKIVLTLSFNTTNPQQAITQTLETTVTPIKKNN